jgi:hypothetical protein
MLAMYVKYFAVQNNFSHTQHIALYLYVTWQQISAIAVGSHQACMQEHNNIQQLYVQSVADVSFYIRDTLYMCTKCVRVLSNYKRPKDSVLCSWIMA